MKNKKQCETYILHGDERGEGYAGGVFFELAQTVIEENGIVIGAAYTEDFNVDHIEVDSIEQLQRIVGVKYAESHISEKLKKRIKRKLQAGVSVLFAGTLCQLESIYEFLNKEYKKFYTIAVNCSGVIQTKVWKDYIDEIQLNGSVITEVYCPYRGKFGVSQNKLLIKFRHGTAYFRDEKQDRLLRLKNARLIYKEECYQCCRMPGDSKADIFLEKYYDTSQKDAAQEDGLTQVSVFSEKGRQMLISSRGRLQVLQRPEINKRDGPLGIRKSKLYYYFWKYYEEYGFSFATDIVLSQMNSSSKIEKNYRFLKYYVSLDVRGISLEKVLEVWGIDEVILYDYSMIGKLIAESLVSKTIYAVIHLGTHEGNKIMDLSLRKEKRQIVESNVPVLIMPGTFMPDVIVELEGYGISRKRILPLSLLMDWEYDRVIRKGHAHTVWNQEKQGIGDIYLITGAQYANKGAQSMLFVTVSELRRKNQDCDIYFLPIDSSDNYPDSVLRKYKFHIIRERDGIYSQIYDLLPQLKAIVDISGYALASKWNCEHFIHILLLAKNNHIPIYYMPQSFGPLDFTGDLRKRICGGLEHATVIFAREKEGYDLLTQKYHLKNCRMSKDLVLQNKRVILENIYTEDMKIGSYKLKTRENIAIIPNIRNYESGDRYELINIYQSIIDELLKRRKNIYIVSHSEDDGACNDIYEMFAGSEQVYLYKVPLDCLEFSILAEEFQYMIASRYHAIVHAYKKGIPCIVIGWAEKYKELLQMFGQEEYGFDVRSGMDKYKIIEALCRMEETWLQEKEKIQKKLPFLQTDSCFDIIE